jgi:hypothetical protein
VNIIGREYIYVEHPGPEAFAKSFFQIGDGCDPLPTSGGMINEEAMIELPSGIQLHALSYKGDIGGWHRRVTEWCKTRGLLWGKIVESRIVLSNGVTLPLQQCRAEVR